MTKIAKLNSFEHRLLVSGVEVFVDGQIHAAGVQPNDLSFSIKTDAEGRYRTRGLDKNTAFVIHAMLPNGELQQIADIDPRDPRTKRKVRYFENLR